MRRALFALVFVVGCKDSKPATPTAAPTPTEKSSQQRSRPHLEAPAAEPGTQPGPPPHLDPMTEDDREKWRADREERRKMREEALDTDHDGVISDVERAQRMKPMRDRLDADHDGRLSPAELAASPNRRIQFDDPTKLDTNKDGDISLQELDEAVQTRREQMRERWRGRRMGSDDGSAGSD